MIYSSGLKRAISTAEGLNSFCNSEILISQGLNEMDFGEWEGKRHDDIATYFPEKYIIWETMPHMHTISQVAQREDHLYCNSWRLHKSPNGFYQGI